MDVIVTFLVIMLKLPNIKTVEKEETVEKETRKLRKSRLFHFQNTNFRI